MKTKKTQRTLLWMGAVLLVLALLCGWYVGDYYPSDETAHQALESTEHVQVELQKDRVVFLPREPEAGLIFYPGGKVEFTAYAPLMQALAQQNILCVLLEMPCNLAVLDMDAAEGIAPQYPQVTRWYLAGHSLGGSMAASYAAKTNTFTGLILLASYSTTDLNPSGLEVLSIYGDRDGVLNREKQESCQENLPASTQMQVIPGGNHAGFGSYGPQDGDGEATISPAEQTAAAAAAMADFMLP